MDDVVLVVVNPASGDQTAAISVAADVLALLEQHRIPYRLQLTESPGHAGVLATEFLESGFGKTILVAGGDGTVHEIVNALSIRPSTTSQSPIDLILFPAGTANALFASLYPSTSIKPAYAHVYPPGIDDQTAYKLNSVAAYIYARTQTGSDGKPDVQAQKLAVTKTEIYDASSTVVDCIFGVVVASTALHAAILHTADQLRGSFPGLGRFKEAAARNITSWSLSHVQIFGPDGQTAEGVQQYDAEQDSMVPFVNDEHINGLNLAGPFFYFLSTTNVDRLEPTFYITSPFTTHKSADADSMDIVVVRPLRRTPGSEDSPSTRASFAKEIVGKFFGAVYDRGSHISLRYDGQEESGLLCTEYFRASGWEWSPVSLYIKYCQHLLSIYSDIERRSFALGMR